MGATEKFCLRWNDFETNISVAFRELREEKDFFDVTLACDDSQIQAHKVILSACSPFFRQILRRNPHQHPLLYLKGVKYKELLSVLNFMYQGEVNVAQEELNSFLAVAEDLRVKGLTQNNSGDSNKGGKSDPKPSSVRPRDPPDRDTSAPPMKRPRPTVIPPSPMPATNNRHSSSYKQDQDEDDILEVTPVKSEPRDPAPSNTAIAPIDTSYQEVGASQAGGQVALEDEYQDDSYDYGEYGEGYEDSSGMIDPNTGLPIAGGADGNKEIEALVFPKLSSGYDEKNCRVWKCADCEYRTRKRKDVIKHIERRHLALTIPCVVCAVTFASRDQHRIHMRAKHFDTKYYQTA